jgi:ABC-type multidrug transport system ATPase subunit
MSDGAIDFRAISKSYRKQLVFNDLSLGVAAGESVGIVGVNGAGKTTLIKCLLDLCDVDSGEIKIFGVSHRERRARARLAFLPERFTPPYYLRGRDFLSYMASLHGVIPGDRERRDILAALDLDPTALDKSVGALSKGMGQKLGLAATLLSNKELLVLDEPMSGLDPKARALFKQELQARRERGQSLFFSTHLLSDVEVLCDRIAILHDGELVFIGSPAQCRGTYAVDDLEKAYLRCVG